MTGSEDDRSKSLHYKFRMKNGGEIYLLSATNPREVRRGVPRLFDSWRKADALAREAGTPAPAERCTRRDEIDQFEVQPEERRQERARYLHPDVVAEITKLFATDPAAN